MFSMSYACGGLSEQLEAQFLSLGLFFVVDVYLSVLLFPVQALQQKKMLDRACRNKEKLSLNRCFIVFLHSHV